MIYIDNDTSYTQRIYIPKDEGSATSGVTGHTVVYQSKDYIITENGSTRIHPDAGYDAITGGSINVYVTAASGFTPVHLEATEDGIYVPTGDQAYTGVTVQVYDGAYQDGYEDGYNSGYTSGNTDGYASGSTDGFEEGYASGYTDGYASGHTDGYNEGYASGYTSGTTDGYASGQTDGYHSGYSDGYQSGYTRGETSGYASGYTDGYASGYTSGYTSGETSGYASGYTNGKEDGFASGYTSGQTIGYASGYTVGYQDGYASGMTSGKTIGYASGYTDGYQDGYASGMTSGKTVGYTSGYTDGSTAGYNSGYTVGYQNGYNAGYVSGQTDGYNAGYLSGRTDGIAYQKSLLTSTAFTNNGFYENVDGWNQVEVAVPLGTIGITYGDNGVYDIDPRDYDQVGFSGVRITVDVDTDEYYNSGYTSGYTDGYSSGMTSGHTEGMADQKALLSSCTLTYNDTFTREDGWSSVTVNVPTVVNNQVLTVNANENWVNQHTSPVVFTPDSGYSGFREVTIDTGGFTLSNLYIFNNPITANGTYVLSADPKTYHEKMQIDVAIPMQRVQITQNGTYTPISGGYSSVEVNVSGTSQTQIVTCTQAEYNALNPPDPTIIYLIKD